MSDLNKLYNEFPDKQERRTRKRKIYSSKDFVPGVKGKLIKLLIAFTIFLISTGLIATILSYTLYLNQLLFLVCSSFVMFAGSWVVSVVFAEKSNIYKVAPLIAISALSWLFSPYSIFITIFVILYNFIVSIIVINRLNLPEKIALNQNLILGSCLFFCLYHIIFALIMMDIPSAQSVKPAIFVVGIVWIFISIFILNIMNITRNAENGATTKSIIMSNAVITTVFAAFVMLIANFSKVKSFIGDVIKWLVRLMVGTPSESAPVQETAPQSAPPQGLMPIADEGPSLLAVILEKIVMVVVIIMLTAAIIFIIFFLFKSVKKLITNIMDYLKDNDKTTSINRYKDEQETVFDKSNFSMNIKDGWEKFKKRFRPREKYSDKKTNRQKIRFLYKELLAKENSSELSKNEFITARDKIIDENATIKERMFAQGYEKARYSEHDVSDDEVTAALSITGKQNETKN